MGFAGIYWGCFGIVMDCLEDRVGFVNIPEGFLQDSLRSCRFNGSKDLSPQLQDPQDIPRIFWDPKTTGGASGSPPPGGSQRDVVPGFFRDC